MVRGLRKRTILSASLILIFAALTTGTSQSLGAFTLEGTTWEITDSDKRSYIFDFQKRSKLRYVSGNGTKGTGSWKQTGDAVYFEVNGKAVEYKGAVHSNEMQGDSKNRRGSSSKWSAVKEQAAVTRPNAPRYPPIAAAAHAVGTVIIEVTIDSTGKVTFASTVDGHPLLRRICETAAKEWQFHAANENTGVRKVRIVFAFSLLSADCKHDVTELAPIYLSPYLVNVRRREVCPRY